MNFGDWHELADRSPFEAALELLRRIRTLMPPLQQRAVFANMPAKAALTVAFANGSKTGTALGGVPYALKDLFDVAGLPTLAGSTFLPEARPTPNKDASIVTALSFQGAVLAAKTHLHEFAYGLTGENPHYGFVDHPRFPGRTSGGSSSGSAAAVAAGIVPLAVGTDTGGSIRVPAAFCGIYGFRMTPHHSFIVDAFPLARSFDTAGWFTQNAGDMGATLAAMIKTAESSGSLRGCFLDFEGWNVHPEPEIAHAYRVAADKLAPRADVITQDTLLNAFTGATEAYAVLQSLEACSVHSAWLDSYHSYYDPAVWQRIDRARHWTPAQITAARAKHAQIRAAWDNYFKAFDFLVLPVAPCPALTQAECTLENRNRILTLACPASLGGLPALTLPINLPSGLTTGLQVIAATSTSPVFPHILGMPKTGGIRPA